MTARAFSPEVKASLLFTHEVLGESKAPWWLYGSAGRALLDVPSIIVRDIDILLSSEDALRLSQRTGWRNDADGGTDRFRSEHFIRQAPYGIDIEFMAGMQVQKHGHWSDFSFQTSRVVDFEGRAFRVPDLSEYLNMLDVSIGRRTQNVSR
ncbi:hypothetical protein [Ponticaulis sp.]|uniref:hypothetical protein n=1 Tax=Ponticaulis sp. TaxID=2020902 RepID=UPI000B6CF1DA|nr:hypothetical protein [Ponticaulis sp.]MAI90300.1 hypothetical protein [Ponticaulis sp.]OUX99941.1 MAG: hypothetical protein CBB65_07655 [Hyphomonadaceae bacterium TMED5]|tara:strand:+ start:279166 stop:279618 length:453 start_codon:yes stop_codon:yes gene_type:complete